MSINIKQSIVIAAKALVMGAADTVPGVSGGTIAILTGIYQRLILMITSFDHIWFKLVFTGKFKQAINKIDWAFLIPFFIGIGSGVLLLAKVVDYLLEYYPPVIWAGFCGLLIISSFYLLKQYARKRPFEWILFVSGIVFATWLSFQSGISLDFNNPLHLFLAGSIAICAMILPGISGSFILLLLGLYEPVIERVANPSQLLELWPFMLGALFGILSFSHLLKWLLNKFEHLLMMLLTGFIIGALVKVWPWQFTAPHSLNTTWYLPQQYAEVTQTDHFLFSSIISCLLTMSIVFAISYYFAIKSNKKTN
ncbi:MAG: DUF368 domain-containing protein [Saccharospirillaceae bacterium]|nr:DUF368 domain-containing protein [Pseudomonadales bacterium]NRB79787.1 DUF368 domain-containing protein [Saccharospirillaceae bacterium]